MSKVLSEKTKANIKGILEKSVEILADSTKEEDKDLFGQAKALLRFINNSSICKTAINILLPKLRNRFRAEFTDEAALTDYEIIVSDIDAVFEEYPERIVRFDEIPTNIWVYKCIVGKDEYSGILCADDEYSATDSVMEKYGEKTGYISVCRAVKSKEFNKRFPNILELRCVSEIE